MMYPVSPTNERTPQHPGERPARPHNTGPSFVKMGVRYKLVGTNKNRWGDGKVHIMLYRRENREWRLLCRPNEPSGYQVHDLIAEEPVTCRHCQPKDPR